MKVPLWVGMPVIRPVEELKVRPVGKVPLRLKVVGLPVAVVW